jgi:hypothetical protein
MPTVVQTAKKIGNNADANLSGLGSAAKTSILSLINVGASATHFCGKIIVDTSAAVQNWCLVNINADNSLRNGLEAMKTVECEDKPMYNENPINLINKGILKDTSLEDAYDKRLMKKAIKDRDIAAAWSNIGSNSEWQTV